MFYHVLLASLWLPALTLYPTYRIYICYPRAKCVGGVAGVHIWQVCVGSGRNGNLIHA